MLNSNPAGKISSTLKDFITNNEPFILNLETPIDLRKVAEKLNFLPVTLNFFDAYGIDLDGNVVYTDLYKVDLKLNLVTDSFIRRSILCQTAKKFPELKELLPKRPKHSIDCAECSGSGIHPFNAELNFEHEAIICACGGLGWKPLGEM